MAREKKSMIGFDPLAWLDDDKKTEPAEAHALEEKTSKKKAKTMIEILSHSIDETALLKAYRLAMDVIDDVTVEFYNELFIQYPALEPMFENTDISTQASKLAQTLTLLVENINDEDALKVSLTEMGKKHQSYGALPEHYPIVAELLVASFKSKIGRSWTKAMSAAWSELLVAAAQIMCAAYTDEMVATDSEVITDEEILTSVNPTLQLNHIQDISKSLALKNDMLTLINDNDEIDIDASNVERIDGSALQLLCALFSYANQNNLVIHWVKPSKVFIESVQTLGMQKILDLV
jgi:hemoglobin-like flavoprotein/anti-anti-sigma regulatory factor